MILNCCGTVEKTSSYSGNWNSATYMVPRFYSQQEEKRLVYFVWSGRSIGVPRGRSHV